MINLELYRIFKIVADEENLTKASEMLHISQPAVTKHIKNLENELKVELFKRSKYGMILNKNGKKLYRIRFRGLIMRKLGIDYGDARVGIAITDPLNITVQGLETIQRNNSDKVVLRRLDEILERYEVDTIVVGMPLNLKGEKTVRAEVTEKFIHKLKCKYNKINIVTVDERLTTVAAHKTMNFLDVNKNKKREIVDTISAVYILETYMGQMKNNA